jgi:polysaccharide deacetylase 2 family uncharacterized protein YibQ
MYRLKPIRVPRRPKPPRALMAGADIAFWALLVIATGLGGARAVAGIPALLAIVLPNAVVPAQAATPPHEALARLTIEPPPPASVHAPQVLYPVVAHPFPAWLGTDPAPATPSAGTIVKDPKIAIVIDDLGGDLAHTDRAIALPKPVTLSFLPFDEATPWLSAEAVRAGHEILVHMPMEAEGDHNPGPLALTIGLPADEIRRRLTLALARVPGAIGINNHMGSRFTADRAALVPVVEELASRHLIFFDSRTTPATQVVSVAHAFGVASAGRDVFLDDEQTAGAVDTQLVELEARARMQGVAIAIGHPHDVTLRALAAWTARAPSRGFTLVTLSEALRLKAERDARQARAGE